MQDPESEAGGGGASSNVVLSQGGRESGTLLVHGDLAFQVSACPKQ